MPVMGISLAPEALYQASHSSFQLFPADSVVTGVWCGQAEAVSWEEESKGKALLHLSDVDTQAGTKALVMQ